MYPEQQVAFIQSQVVSALAEIEAMKIENLNDPKKWTAEDFRNIPLRFGLDHNSVIGLFTGR